MAAEPGKDAVIPNKVTKPLELNHPSINMACGIAKVDLTLEMVLYRTTNTGTSYSLTSLRKITLNATHGIIPSSRSQHVQAEIKKVKRSEVGAHRGLTKPVKP